MIDYLIIVEVIVIFQSPLAFNSVELTSIEL